jgi:hypothetical protein
MLSFFNRKREVWKKRSKNFCGLLPQFYLNKVDVANEET